MRTPKWLAVLLICLTYSTAFAIPLDSWPTWSTAQPYVSKQVPPGAMIVRGSGTNAYYVLEVDPTTGELPVTLSGAGITIDYSGTPGSPVPASAAYIAGIDGTGDLQGISVNGSGEVNVQIQGPYGQATMANSVPVTLASDQTAIEIQASSPLDVNVTNAGQSNMAGSIPVVIANNQSSIPISNFPTTVAVDKQAADASTIRTTEGSRSYADSIHYDYTGGTVTTGAWTEIDAATAVAMNYVCITDQSGQIMELGSGAAAAETRIFLIARGFSGCIPLRIAASTRLSLKAVSSDASTGDFVLSGMN